MGITAETPTTTSPAAVPVVAAGGAAAAADMQTVAQKKVRKPRTTMLRPDDAVSSTELAVTPGGEFEHSH